MNPDATSSHIATQFEFVARHYMGNASQVINLDQKGFQVDRVHLQSLREGTGASQKGPLEQRSVCARDRDADNGTGICIIIIFLGDQKLFFPL